MNSSEVSLDSASHIEDIPPQGADARTPPGPGLRSLQGIRWLLLVGGLVVVVSVIRLLAAEWHQLSAAVQFLVLAVGSVGIYGAGNLIRRRLHLPQAGTALHGLFVLLVPLLAWGAGRQGLAMTLGGAVSVAVGLGLLWWACRRLLLHELGHAGRVYPFVLGVLLMATPWLPVVGVKFGLTLGYFLGVAAAGGLLLRWGSVHINRFFFHRDRRDGVDRPLQLLPFALLVVVYGAAMASFPRPLVWMAVPLAFVAWALIDTGEEYTRALEEATGEAVVKWPQRSVQLLVLGFAAMAVAMSLAPWVGGAGLAVISTLVAGRLLTWALRSRHTVAYGFGLSIAMVAYHALPTLVPDLAKQAYAWVLATVGIESGSAALGLGDVGLLALLVASAVLWQRRLSSNMMRLHSLLLAVHGVFVLAASLGEPQVLRIVALLVLPLMLWATIALRRAVLLPIAYASLVGSALAWGWQTSDATLWTETGAVASLLASAVFLGCGKLWQQARQRRVEGASAEGGVALASASAWTRTLVWPVLGVTTVIAGLGLITFGLASGAMLMLLLALCLGLAIALLDAPPLGLLAGLATVVGVLAAVETVVDSRVVFAVVVQALLLAAWGVERLLDRTPDGSRRWCWWTATIVSFSFAVGIPLAIAAYFEQGTFAVDAWIWLAFGAYLLDASGRRGYLAQPPVPADRSHRTPGGGFVELVPGVALAVLAVFPAVLAIALGVTSWIAVLLLVGMTLAAFSSALLRGGGAVMARFYGVETAELCRVLHSNLVALRKLWRVTALSVALIWFGPAALLLACWLAGETLWWAIGRRPSLGDKNLSLGVTFLPLLHLAAYVAAWGTTGRDLLVPTLMQGTGPAVLVVAAWTWSRLAERVPPLGIAVPRRAMQWVEILATVSALWGLLSLVGGVVSGRGAESLQSTGLVVGAALYAWWNFRRAWTLGATSGLAPTSYSAAEAIRAWAAHGWLALACWVGVVAGWLPLDQSATGLVFIVVALSLEAWTALHRKSGMPHALASSNRMAASLWALAGSAVSLLVSLRVGSPWGPILPLVLASILFTLRAKRGESVKASAVLASGLFGLALTVMVLQLPALGPEMLFLGPGLALLVLSDLLRPRVSRELRNRLFTAGAVSVYGTPMMGLLGELGWVWQIALLLSAIGFGVLSFRLRSRSLLTVSTAALLVDLAFFIVKLRRTEPTILWVGGIVFGLALMASAALLEHRREEVEQRLRIWGRELKSW